MTTAADEAGSDWRVVGPSWASVRAAFLSMKPLFISAAVAMLLLSTVSFYGPGWFGEQSRSAAALIALAINIGVALLSVLVFAPVAVAVHRFILLGERTGGIISLRPSYTRRFALWAFLACLVGFAVISVTGGIALMSFTGAFGKLLFVASALVLWVCWIFSVLIFPAVAIEEASSGWKDRLSASWRRMDGHFWIFIGVSIVTVLPVVLVMMVIGGVEGALVAALHLGAKNPLAFGAKLISDLVAVLMAMLGAAIASHFYARFRDQAIPPPA